MRQITVKYSGQCAKCGNALEVGQSAIYEKTTGIFCVGCEPTDVEEIRTYRQEKADRRADRYDGWAHKREVRASAQLNSYPEIRHDIAFNTQPGHIPFRARMIAADNRAFESLRVAERMRGKADNIRGVRVAGDAERKRQAERDALRPLLAPGVRVNSPLYDTGIILKVNQKTAKIKFDRGFIHNDPIEWLTVLKQQTGTEG